MPIFAVGYGATPSDEKGRATSEMHYLEDNEWGTTARIDTMLAKMVKSPNGRYYSSKKENSFDTAEEFFAVQIAWGYLALWLGSE